MLMLIFKGNEIIYQVSQEKKKNQRSPEAVELYLMQSKTTSKLQLRLHKDSCTTSGKSLSFSKFGQDQRQDKACSLND